MNDEHLSFYGPTFENSPILSAKEDSKRHIGYYSLATSVKEGEGYKKKIIHRLGRLTDEQADTYRTLLKGINAPNDLSGLCFLRDITFDVEKRYFDVLLLSKLWEKIGLNKVFPNSIDGNQRVSTEQIARILTINRLLSPTSKIRTISWLSTTMLPTIMGFDAESYRKTKIFESLDLIHKRKPVIEKLFSAFSKSQKSSDWDLNPA